MFSSAKAIEFDTTIWKTTKGTTSLSGAYTSFFSTYSNLNASIYFFPSVAYSTKRNGNSQIMIPHYYYSRVESRDIFFRPKTGTY